MASRWRFLSAWVKGKIKIDTFFAWLFGVVFLLIALLVSLTMPEMKGSIVLRIIVALSAAAITAGIPGLFTLNFLSPGKVLTVKVTGALLVFLIICAVDANPSQSIAFIQMSLILLTPLIIRQGLKRQRMKVTNYSLLLSLHCLHVVRSRVFFTTGRWPIACLSFAFNRYSAGQ